jgi:protein involved in polysaccharide export with SLBB domain
MWSRTPEIVYRAKLCWLVVSAALVLFCFSGLIRAQESDSYSSRETSGRDQSQSRTAAEPDATEPDSTEADFSDTESSGAPAAQVALPAYRLIEILRQQPELLDVVKGIAIQYLQDQGRSVSDSDVTDEVLFRRIEQDPQLRRLLTRELKTRGYLGEDNLDYLDRYSSERIGSERVSSDLNQPPVLRRDRPTREAGERVSTDMNGPLEERGEPSQLQSSRRPSGRLTRQQTTRPPEDQNQPVTTRKPNPYPNLPSLQDLYRQIPSRGAALKRFGAEIFLNGTGNLDNARMDLPAGPDYVLGPGDGLNIEIWGSVSRRLTRTVDREGRIALPEVGAVVVAGQTVAQTQELVQKALGAQFRDARVDISLTRLRMVRVYVVGDVERPGAYDISSLSTPLNALCVAGGPTAQGSLRTLRHYRGQQLIREVDLYELLLQGVRSDVERLEPGDTILVPPVGPQVTVAGMVRRPAIYELKGESELADVLQLAGGVLVSATLRQINVERIEAHERRVMLKVNLPNANDKESLNTALGSFRVQDGDRVTISPILPYSEKTVYLEGHVFRPGKYPYHEGLQISDLLHSYQDLLPEPADRAEIVRLVPPDYHPEVIEFRLGDVLTGDDPIELQPFDTVRVLGRYQIDAPKVSIYGEVLRPGEYPLAQGMTAAELVRLAGGFKRSAFTKEADITSYVVQDGSKVVTQNKAVEIASALSGNSAVDAILKPGDVVTIHQLAGWKDIGASVTVSGEVLYPGTYGIEEGEKLSTLLKRAGGFRTYAYPEGAVLERMQVRELAERSRRQLIQRIEAAGANQKLSSNSSGQEQAALTQAMLQQRQEIVSSLRARPANGRLVIKISRDIATWQNTPADVELRAGDLLTIPKRPSFVLISGQVYNASAITYTPGKNAEWYLRQAGGPTDLANKKDIYIIRANGSVFGQGGSGSGWWKGNVLSATMRPGDTLVVPEKIISPSNFWKNALTTAQLVSSMAIAAAAVRSF